jgi:hypothetical protein
VGHFCIIGSTIQFFAAVNAVDSNSKQIPLPNRQPMNTRASRKVCLEKLLPCRQSMKRSVCQSELPKDLLLRKQPIKALHDTKTREIFSLPSRQLINSSPQIHGSWPHSLPDRQLINTIRRLPGLLSSLLPSRQPINSETMIFPHEFCSLPSRQLMSKSLTIEGIRKFFLPSRQLIDITFAAACAKWASLPRRQLINSLLLDWESVNGSLLKKQLRNRQGSQKVCLEKSMPSRQPINRDS